MDAKERAHEVDLQLAETRQQFARFLMEWRATHNLSLHSLQQLSLMASGRRRVSATYFQKLEVAAQSIDAALEWNPGMTFFKGLEELNQFIEAGVIPQGARVRPSILNGVRPIADSDGRPLEYSDFVLLYHGLRPTPGPPGLHLTCLIEERNLGRTLLAALESCGRSPLDLEVAMLAIPGDTTSLRRAVSGLEQPAIQDLVDWMPDLRHALYQVTGREFSEAELLDICENLDKVTVA